MSNLGLGVMIGMLGGNAETVEAHNAAIGKTIADINMDADGSFVRICFTDGTALRIADEGQSCCETRYMSTDDDLAHFIGADFAGVEVKDGPTTEERGEPHETQFLEIKTSRGVFTLVTHNEHNGYYGGFWIVCATEGE